MKLINYYSKYVKYFTIQFEKNVSFQSTHHRRNICDKLVYGTTFVAFHLKMVDSRFKVSADVFGIYESITFEFDFIQIRSVSENIEINESNGSLYT